MRSAADAVTEFTRGRSLDEYKSELLLRSAVERQLTILGEALAQLSRLRPDLSDRIPERGSIIGFRNVLIHGYAAVVDELVWGTIHRDLPKLRTRITELLEELDRQS